ncbi:MAG: RNA polymerase sigma factor, partial [Planctomycetota bacterium]
MMNRQDPVPDEALIEAVQRGDRNAAATLYDRHVDRVHRICCRIVLDRSQVPDCVQKYGYRNDPIDLTTTASADELLE